MKRARNNLFLGLTILATIAFGSTAWADSTVTRTLYRMVTVPAGANITVENLVGHMTVTQNSGSVNVSTLEGASIVEQQMLGKYPLQVTATVVAGGRDAQALAQSIKLDVTTSSNQVTVHVYYPVDKYRTYLYNPRRTSGNDDDSYCFLGILCVHGNTDFGVHYQGTNIQVNQNSSTGTPLYVNVAVQLPAGIHASLSNVWGLLEASNLTDTLSLNTQRGDVSVQNLNGNLTTSTDGGDVLGANLQGEVNLETDGGDANLKTVSGTLHAETDGGDLHLYGNLSALSTLYARTDGGDMRVSGDVSGLHSLDVSTDGGDAVLHVTNLSMHLEASTDGGDVSVHLPNISGNVVSKDDYFSGDIGKPIGQGTIDSDGGDITVSGN